MGKVTIVPVEKIKEKVLPSKREIDKAFRGMNPTQYYRWLRRIRKIIL